MKALVSVVIPTYNHAHFLGRALQSVLDQTYSHWEALVVDNHSDDNTDEVVKNFNDPRIRLLKIHNNGVIAASRNLGIKEAKGEWIAFLDSDDCWYPKKLEIMMQALKENNSYDVLSNDEWKVDIKTGTKSLLQYGPYEEDFYKVLLVQGNRLSPSATMVRREFLTLHNLIFNESPNYATVEDYGFWLDLARAGAKFKFIHEVQGEFSVHPGSSSSQFSRHFKNGEALLRDHVFNIQKFHSSPKKLWKQLSPRLHMGQVRQCFTEGQLGMALKLGLEMWLSAPRETAMYLFSKLIRNSIIKI